MVSWNTKKRAFIIFQTFYNFIPIINAQEFQKYEKSVFFLSYQQHETANLAQSLAHFCPVVDCPQKSIMEVQFLAFF